MTKKIKAILALLFVSTCITLIGLQQVKFGGATRVEGVVEANPNGSGGSEGPAGNLQAADGVGGFLDTGCQANTGGVTINCNTFVNSPTISGLSKTCPVFPDSNFWNVDVSSYPYDQWNNFNMGMYPNLTVAFTGATWAGGTATVTANTSTMVDGHDYPISGAVSGSCLTGGDCGFNSQVSTLGGTGSTYVVHVIDGSHFSYPLVGNPGTWSSGGLLYTATPVLLHHVPEMNINFALNSTPTLDQTNSVWDSGQQTSDSGPYPWTSSFLMSLYNNTIGGGYVSPVVTTATSYPSFDRHVLTVNMDQCKLYETFNLQTDGPPWHNVGGAIWDLRSNDLRTMHKVLWYGNDSTGLSSAEVAGMAIWPGVLTYAELFSGSPIKHAIRIAVPTGPGLYSNPGGAAPTVPYPAGFVWPGTHVGSNAIPLGIRWVLDPGFDGTTCHFRDCAGLAWPGYMQRLITALKTYGGIFADTGGGFVGVSSDAVISWGATDDPSSPTYMLTGYMHGIMWQNGHTIDTTIHVVNTLSGALR